MTAKLRPYLSVICTAVLFSSCLPVILMPKPNCTKGYIAYMRPITDDNEEIALKTTGVYISETGKASFFLYNNGKVKSHTGFFQEFPNTDMLKAQDVMKNIDSDNGIKPSEAWGDFEISGDQFIMQDFNPRHWAREAFCKRWVYEVRGKILNDSTIEIYLEHAIGPKDTLFDRKCVMHFYPLVSKPDSTKAWFNNKKWYREKLHESRK